MTLTFPRLKAWLERELNFFRIHLLVFTFVPLIVSGILYGLNGEFHIRESHILGIILFWLLTPVCSLHRLSFSFLFCLHRDWIVDNQP